MPTDFDVIVIGAGPAGSSAAILLARAGWRVALVEKRRFPRRKVCGECVAASNLALLDKLGVGREIRASSGPALDHVVLMQGRESITARLPLASVDGRRSGVALGREILDTSLMEQAMCEGARVFQPWSVEAVRGEPGRWSCTIRDVSSNERISLQARVAIDAHGSWESLSATRAGGRRSRRRSDLFAFKANFRGASLSAGAIAVLAFDGGYGGMVLAGGGLTTMACCIRRDRLEASRALSPGLDAGETVQAFLAHECTGVRTALADASREGPWLATGPIDPGIHLPRPKEPFRIGNAAGEAHPIVGEGMSMALQSSWLLCARLIDAGCRSAPPDGTRQQAISASFSREWKEQFGRRLRIASMFAHAAMRPVAATSLTRLVRRWPQILTLGAEWAGKSHCAVGPALMASLSPARTAIERSQPAATSVPAIASTTGS